MNEKDLVDYLREVGVCEVCQLRYLRIRDAEYGNPQATLNQLNISNPTSIAEPATKKCRMNACPTCLGLFSSTFQEELVEGILATDFGKYECDDIVVGISTPMLLQVRNLAMWFGLVRKFGNKVDRTQSPDVPLKEAIKIIINPVICKKLNKTYDANGIMININLVHAQECQEVEIISKLNKATFSAPNGKCKVMSRGLLEKQYTPAQVSETIFEKYLPIPPETAEETLKLGGITLQGPTVFVAGRYRKLSRELSHTPWVLNGKRLMEDSIEEIIIRNIAPSFCTDSSKVIFMSSGREDVDVRCLGKGRPFVLEIPDSTRTKLPKELALQMEQGIDSSLKVSIRNLQMVQREDLVHIKTGEEKKRKFYRALCKIDAPATEEVLKKLNATQGFEIQQKTPIRVLHRRPLHTRPRMIYSLKAYVHRDNPCLLVLDIVSQAGTYIKELVHGEFGRTTPSVSSIIGGPIDIMALDVVGIDLDWPADIDNSAK